MEPTWATEDGSVRLYLGDALEVLSSIDDSAVDAVVIDPPYSSGTRREGAKGLRKSMNRTTGDDDWFGTDSLTTQGFVWMMRAIAMQSKRALTRGGHLLTFIDWRMSANLAAAIESTDMRYLGMLVWDKVAFGMGNYFRNQHELILHFSHGRTRPAFRHDVPNVLRFSRMIADSEHDTQKPVELMEALITTTSDRCDVVGDWFMGAGSTGVACARNGRRFIGIERDPKHFATAKRRIIEELTRTPLFDPPPSIIQRELI